VVTKGLDMRKKSHRCHDFTPVSEEGRHVGYRCVCGDIVRHVGTEWEVYHRPGSAHIFRCACGVEIEE
jgi:hypothetical protein